MITTEQAANFNVITINPQLQIYHSCQLPEFVYFCHFDRREKSPGCGATRFLTFIRNDRAFMAIANNLAEFQWLSGIL